MGSGIDISIFWVGFWLYLASFVLFAVYAKTGGRIWGMGAIVLFEAGFLLHTTGLITRWAAGSHPPLATMYEYSLSMAWLIAAVFIFLVIRFRRIGLGVVVSPVLVLVLAVASMLPKKVSALMPALQSYWFYIHVTLAAASEGALLVASGAGIVYLVRGRGKGKGGGVPDFPLLEEIIAGSIRVGYPLFTIGALFAGAIWAHYAWGSFWSWDPKETGALVIWLFYTLVLHQNAMGRWRGRTLAVMSVIGLVITLLSFAGNLFLGGLHSYI